MVAIDPCSIIKDELENGSYTNYTTSFPKYIENKEPFLGGEVYIFLKNSRRDPVQTFQGSIIFHRGSCTVVIVAPTDTIRDALYNDVIAILNASSKNYELDFTADQSYNPELLDLSLDVNMII